MKNLKGNFDLSHVYYNDKWINKCREVPEICHLNIGVTGLFDSAFFFYFKTVVDKWCL